MMGQNNITIDIVCPVYKGFVYISTLFPMFEKQKNVTINKVIVPLTLSDNENDNKVKEYCKNKNFIVFDVLPKDFSHSITREKAIRDFCTSSIVVMLSQDIKLIDEYVFYNLVKDIASKETVYNYARQICTNKTIEKYIRKKNYPLKSYIVTKDDIEKMQLMAFFASDACSAYDRNVFLELNGYQGYNVMMNEDQLYSKIILDAGYKKKYCADAVVEHSHKYKLRQLYRRYYETGIFYREIKVFEGYKSINSGFSLAFYILWQALKHFDIPVLFRWLPDMMARYLGMKNGKKDGKSK